MTAQSLLVVLREKQEMLETRLLERADRIDNPQYTLELIKESMDLETSIRVIEEVLRSTRETRKHMGDNTLETEADLGLGSSTPR